MAFTVGDHQSRSTLDTVLTAQVHIFLCDELLESHTGLGQLLLCHTAVGAGDPGEQNCLAFYGLDGSGLFASAELGLCLFDGIGGVQLGGADVIDLTMP